MNLLIESAPDYLVVRGKKININTDFALWVEFFIASKHNDVNGVKRALLKILHEIPECSVEELMTACIQWSNGNDKADNGPRKSGSITSSPPFDFEEDGNVIYCELWEYFPKLMDRGISYHEGIELIKILLHNEDTMLWHRAFARTGDFSKMSTEQKNYWQKQRAIWIIPDSSNQDSIDNIMSGAF